MNVRRKVCETMEPWLAQKEVNSTYKVSQAWG